MTGAAAGAEAEPCVLIVDDEDGIREALAEVVEMGGCQAIVAANGAEAMKILASHHPCLIILDLLMPVMNGVEMLDAMKAQPELATLAVVISTSAPSRAPAGIPVIPKPIDVNVVWDWMRRTCRCTQTDLKVVD
jgi:CheY-like chemotaxis protein